MKINALVVCVDYADLLARGLRRWLDGVESLTIVTSPADHMTTSFASLSSKIRMFQTNAFYENGADFNKGLAMEQARWTMPWEDWILFFDADVVPPDEWKDRLDRMQLLPGLLYGCWRIDEQGMRLNDDTVGYGYFQLFHSADPLAQDAPLIEGCWRHAGNSDSKLMMRWRDRGRLAPPLPFSVCHPGGKSHNWFGRGQHAKFAAMEAERKRRGGGWPSIEGERI